MWRCHYATHTTLLFAVDAHRFANIRWPSPSTGAKQTTQTSGFFVIFYWKSDTHTFGVWRCHRHCGIALGVSFMCASTPTTLFIGGRGLNRCHTNHLNEWFFVILGLCKLPVDKLQGVSWLILLVLHCIIWVQNE